MRTIKKIELRVSREKLAESTAPYNARIERPEQAVKLIKSILEGVDQERFLVMPVDIKNKILGYIEVARGSVDECPVDPREVFRAAIVMGASALFLAHNHPSGSTDPSPEDMKLTRRVCRAGELLGVPVLDHLIVAGDGSLSFAESGIMPEVKYDIES